MISPSGDGGVVNAVVDLPTGPVFYRDSGGGGVAVVFLHAASGNSMTWEHQVPVFIEAGYRFIAIDYRGIGGKSSSALDWSDQIEVLVERITIDRFHLVGTALGGGTAFQYVLAYPHRVRSVVVANSHGNVTDRDYVEMGKRIRPSPQFDALPVDFRELGPSYRAADPQGAARWLALSQSQAHVAHVPPPSTLPADRFALKPERAVTWAKLEALRVPTLLIAGDADLYMPPSVLRMFAAHMEHAETAVIPETGHSAYWENPEVFNRTVLAFIRQH